MKKSRLLGAVCAVAIACTAVSASAALIGVLPTTPGGTDWQAYYDEDADLTWLQNAAASGWLSWGSANAWAAGLDINGVTGWRMPDTLQPDPACSGQSTDPEWSHGYNCTGSEMGNLFYNVLGGEAGSSIRTTHNSNYDLFSGIYDRNYWTSAAYPPSYDDISVVFSFQIGWQSGLLDTVTTYGWAVHDGDVGSPVVPIPPALWLFGSGLLGLLGMARKKAST